MVGAWFDGKPGARPRGWAVAILAWGLLPGPPSWAHQEAPTAAELQAEIRALRADFEARLRLLEARLAALEEPEGAPQEEAADRDALRAAARAAAGGEAPTRMREEGPDAAGERNLNRLNPEISFTGDVLFTTSDSRREEFSARGFELSLQSALDPFSYTRWLIDFGEEGEVEVEEGYAGYNGFGGGWELLVGRFRQSFGVLNRWHVHSLPQVDYPLALVTYFGEEGLAQSGLSLSWLVPRPWASANEVTLQLTDGENEEAFGGEHFEQLTGLVHVKSYWDINPATYFEWGLSGVAGEGAAGETSRVWGSDVTFHWQPPRRARYRELTWRSEVLLSQRDDADGLRHEAWGFYSYLEGLLARNLYAGLRYDRVEDPFDPREVGWRLSPYLSFWQSEYVRLRAEYGRLKDPLSGETEDRFTLQLTWAAGPHKHERY